MYVDELSNISNSSSELAAANAAPTARKSRKKLTSSPNGVTLTTVLVVFEGEVLTIVVV